MSAERLIATYTLDAADRSAASAAGEAIALEQTVELPDRLVPDGVVRDSVVGQVVDLAPVAAAAGRWQAMVAYPADAVGGEITQLVNLLYGNAALMPGVRLVGLDLPDGLLARFAGPQYGLAGLRAQAGRGDEPLLATALKPMGLAPDALADLAYRFALGGMDIIKDDHGLADQPWAPFPERVAACGEAVARANRETSGQSLYTPNVTADGPATLDRARQAQAAGAGALLLNPGPAGLGTLHALAAATDITLPVLAHPSFLGSFVAASPDQGIAADIVLGLLPRLAGADAVIYPNWGGRFALDRATCLAIAEAARGALGQHRAAAPMPGGGMTPANVPEMRAAYGDDVVYLMGAGIYELAAEPGEATRRLRAALGRDDMA